MKNYIYWGLAAVVVFMTQGGSAAVCEKENIFGLTTYITCPEAGDPPENRFCCGSDKNPFCCDTPFGIDDETLKQFADKSVNLDKTDNKMPTAQALNMQKLARTEPVALAQVQETPIVPETAKDQEGLRDTVDRVKTKVNGTVRGVGGKLNPKEGIKKAKDKVKQKVKDKVEEKAVKKLDPTGTIKSLPVILSVIGAIIVALIGLCIICCCCCPFCLLHKRRNRGMVHNPTPTEAHMAQPLQPVQPMQTYPSQQPYPPQGYPAQPGYPPQQPYPPQGYPAQPGYPPQQPYPPQPNNPSVYPVDQPPPYSDKQFPYNPNYPQ